MTTDSATQPGAPAQQEEDQINRQLEGGDDDDAPPPDEGKKTEREPTERELALDAISRKRNESLRAEGVDLEAPAAAADAGDGNGNGGDDLDPEKQIQRQADQETIETLETLRGRKLKLVVDGQEQVVPLEDLARQVSKAGAADYRLQEATRLLEEAKALAAAAGKAPAKPEGEDGDANATNTKTDPRAKARVVVEKILDGDTDGAVEDLASMIAPPTAALDVDAITQETEARIEKRQVLKSFTKDYSDVMTNPRLGRMVDEEFAEIVSKLPPDTAMSADDFGQHLRTAGDRVRGFVKSLGGGQAKPDDTPNLEERNRRKAEQDPPRIAGARTTSAEQPPPVDSSASRSSAIADIAKARGQVF